MPEFDIYSPKEISKRIISIGITKAKLPILSLVLLGVLAGAFIGFGALFYTIIVSDTTLGFAWARLIGGLCFALGLFMVVIAGAELFTGNVLITMAWAERKVSLKQLLRNWIVICISNAAGAAGLALLVFLSGSWKMNGGAIGHMYLNIAISKSSTPFWELFFLGILCNNLVCLAIWMSFAGRTILDKCIAVTFPVAAFVAAGFEHSIANMYFYAIAGLLKASGHPLPSNAEFISISGALHNFIPVIMGNIIGGSLLVAFIYWVIYHRNKPI
jgi:formate/nitrite transporter